MAIFQVASPVYVQWFPNDPEKCQERAIERLKLLAPSTDRTLGYLWRLRDVLQGDYADTIIVRLEIYPIRTESKQGWTIDFPNSRGFRFISRENQKKYAHPTLIAAQASFLARKKRQASIYDSRADRARKAAIKATRTPILDLE